jgi:hypothetical protein
MPILQANIDAVATVNGTPLGGFTTISGGEVSAETVHDRPPGSPYPLAVGAPKVVSNITVGRMWDEGRDGALLPVLNAAVGQELPCTVARIRRDGKGNQTGQTIYAAFLVRVGVPDGDTNSTDKAMLELEFSPWGGPA